VSLRPWQTVSICQGLSSKAVALTLSGKVMLERARNRFAVFSKVDLCAYSSRRVFLRSCLAFLCSIGDKSFLANSNTSAKWSNFESTAPIVKLALKLVWVALDVIEPSWAFINYHSKIYTYNTYNKFCKKWPRYKNTR